MRHTALLCLGSNMADVAARKIKSALEAISHRIGPVTASSGKYNTPCYHNGRVTDDAGYLNEVILASTPLDAKAIDAICKDIEAALGRDEEMRRRRNVPIDIDLVALDHDIIRPIDFNSPYFIKGYKNIMEKDVKNIANAWGVEPDSSCDFTQWQEQYEKNTSLWDRLFGYLASTDIAALEPGKVVIVPDRLWINVMQYTPKDFDSTPAEAHKKYIDLQYTLCGEELMGLVRDSVEVTIPYNEQKDVEKYRPTGEVRFTKATPDRFFLYFPSDIHQPSVASAATPPTSHKIVCKIEYLP